MTTDFSYVTPRYVQLNTVNMTGMRLCRRRRCELIKSELVATPNDKQ